jgi:hypothetical protein
MHKEEILIITKTYPLPSSNYREHTCVGAINDDGEMRRLFPVPFRLMAKGQQFQKWQWINAEIEKASDRRPESYNINIDSIQIHSKVGTENRWAERIKWITPNISPCFEDIEALRLNGNITFGFLRPIDLELEIIEEKEKDWSDIEKSNLAKDGLFDSQSVKNRPELRKLPFKFYYSYTCSSVSKEKRYRHLITDWEVGMLFWNCYNKYGINWERKFREKLEIEFRDKKELILMLGNMHRYQDQWLIIGLIYPPKK